MVDIYYTAASGSFTSSLVINKANNETSVYSDVTLEISASGYETSGSTYTSTVGTLRALIKSGSIVYASFPTEETNIYYVDSDEFSTLLATPPIPTFFTSSFSLDFNFQPISALTSSGGLFAIAISIN